MDVYPWFFCYNMNMDSSKILKLTFAGGTGSVTGANFLLEGEGKRFLIDCGLAQGSKMADEANWKPFVYDPSTIDALFITHAHIDHIGRIPKLVHDGFKGLIYSTIPTKDITELMLADTANILSHSDHGDNEMLKEIYSPDILKRCFDNWQVIDYHQDLAIGPFIFRYRDAGHVLGSGMLEIIYNNKKIIFTGDLGNSPSPLLRDTEAIKNVDYLIMESVYGDRNHIARNERRVRLEETIQDNYKRKGTLVIPTFSLERAQELLFEIDQLVEHDRVPEMPIFFDSPLAIHLTKVYAKYTRYFNDFARKQIGDGDDIFNFPGLKFTLLTEESKEILHEHNPKIVIAGSGMSNGGRILHHEANYLPDANNTLLLTGYQAMGTMGRIIEDGSKEVHISGQVVAVRAHIVFIDGYSGHKDSDHLVEFVEQTADTLQKVFVVMGEPKSSLFLTQRLRDYLGVAAFAPNENDVVELDCNGK
ncbi:MAG: RNA-metabolising metallo-beta-lactamase, metallo-beta-lactamase family protein [Candidatus Nomurabacteria bacterium]|nr:RNA-metabolising metallo-beta-lactamase, metallo-beta-lactamase family protein [Candidatus Nomurabacteria bacterium]